MAAENRHNFGFLPSGYAEFPEPVLEQIFSYLKVPQVLTSQLVCKAWKEVIETTQFWSTRLQRFGVKMNQEILDVNEYEYLRLLKSICLCGENVASERFYEKKWNIREEDILKATSYLMLSRKPARITLELRSEPESIHFLGILIKMISYNACFLEIKESRKWRESNNSNGWLLEQLNLCHSRCEVTTLETSATSSDLIPTTVRNLFLAYMVNPKTKTLMELPLCKIQQSSPVLSTLGVHVPAGYATDHLQAVPNARSGNYLYLSGLATDDHITSAVAAARQLQPSMGWYVLCFPQCSLTVDQLMQLFRDLGQAQCKVFGSVELANHKFSNEEKHQLSGAVKAALSDCWAGVAWKEDDEAISFW